MVGDWVGCLWWVTGWGVCDGRLDGVLWWVTGWGVCDGDWMGCL